MSLLVSALLGLALILVLTAMTGYFVAQEFAYVAVDRNKLRKLADEGDEPAERALKVTSQLSFTLSAAQFGITVTALLVGYVSEPLVGRALTEWLGFTDLPYAARVTISLALVMLFSTGVQMVLGELAPKNLAIARTVPLARALSRSTLIYLKVAGPIVRLFDKSSTWLLRKVGIEPVEELEHGATAEDLPGIIDESRDGGLLDEELSEILEGGLRFRELTAGDVMTPRVRVETITRDQTAADLIALLDLGWSRFPVVGRDGDDIVGIAGLSDVLRVPRDERASVTVGSLVEPPTVVPESAPLPVVLDQLRTAHRQLAVVIDEHGGFAGVVSLEDLAEEVVGEIRDADDPEAPGVQEIDEVTWVAPANLRLDELEVTTDLEILGEDGQPLEASTLSGLILSLLGRVAAVGDSVEVEASYEIHPDESGDDEAEEHEHRHDHHRHKERVHLCLDVLEVDRHVPSVVQVRILPIDESGHLVRDESDDPTDCEPVKAQGSERR